MTDLFKEYPELAEAFEADPLEIQRLEQIALNCVVGTMQVMTDRELVDHCLANSTHHPLIHELASRMVYYLDIMKAAAGGRNGTT